MEIVVAGEKKKQDATIGDSTSTARLTLWEEEIGKVLTGVCLHHVYVYGCQSESSHETLMRLSHRSHNMGVNKVITSEWG